ncbi:FtsX-like permease family protein [Viridibacillus sp. YIM B01967]|uniref:FtsX-like permease family protein n=1 Tax=Viridibacillus soli TaxID=2798301 RepID=A0ABS1H3I4_9BACL|nr:FtsX-like permease family protein [Viridibacillus soli]MBK3493967.1 FtsX-like permease family protein [Viridibacillus soli]
MDIYMEGKKHSLIITGIYQAIANMSYSARITEDVPKIYNPNYKISDMALINLIDIEQSDQVVSDLNKKYKKSISAVTQQTFLDSVYKEAVAVLIMPLSVMGILFLTVTFIIIFSVCRITVRKESSTYGIYKSIGMTSNKIRWSITLEILILSALGALFGVFVGVKILPLVLENILSQYGLIKLPLVVSWGISIGVACFSIIAACLGCWISTRVISKTSPRILIVE